jgi:hypothetical protein
MQGAVLVLVLVLLLAACCSLLDLAAPGSLYLSVCACRFR